ncbi:MAG: tandem-95 repeat protein, partial [Zoogloeaceae bacterium]|nr:tandem-95 repeat protein [Zoogloeaceae bacterium]
QSFAEKKSDADPFDSREVLKYLGITATGQKDYENRFAISLTKRDPVEIGGGTVQTLLVQQAAVSDIAADGKEPSSLAAESVNSGEIIMWIDVSMPAIELAEAVQVVKTASTAADAPAYQLGVCVVIRGRYADDYKTILDNETISPYFAAQDYTREFSGGKFRINQGENPSEIIIIQNPEHGTLYPSYGAYGSYDYTVNPDSDFVGNDYAIFDVKYGDNTVRIHYVLSVDAGQPSYIDIDKGSEITIVQYPEHGTLEVKPGGGSYRYTPDSDFVGNDYAIFNVRRLDDNTTPNNVVRIPYDLSVPDKGDPSYIDIDIWGSRITDPTRCPHEYWKISLTGDQSIKMLAQALVFSPESMWRDAELSAILADAAAAFQGFATLPGLALAQTLNYRITLDTSAAGWGWYIDLTPLDNSDDYLPTADPNIWKAKPGTEAEGKMDLLSVLLHEYGHVLGLEHSGDPRDFMGASLQPGERRLPTAAELQLMADLIAQIKAENDALTPSPSPASGRGENNDPLLPIPGRSTTSQTLARRGPEDDDGDGLQIASYLGVVNPTLINGNFSTGNINGWAAQGQVHVTDDTVTLTESLTVQTHLAQAFMVNEGDRYLSFTLSAQNLTSNASGPSDAFEVALLDANTGLPVVGIVNLTNTDSLLNLQTNGTEYLASSVRKALNADGSATYFIELPQSLAGNAVMLSFDLLGFGAAQSSVTLRDIRLLDEEGGKLNHAPVAPADRSVSVVAGQPYTFNPLAGAFDADGDPLTVQWATQPTHGSLVANADGTYTYTANAAYAGADSLSWRVSDGIDLSANTCTLSLTVIAANIAPVANDAIVSLDENASLLIDFMAWASDADGDALTAQIVTNPAHGTLVANADGTYTYTPNANYHGSDSAT